MSLNILYVPSWNNLLGLVQNLLDLQKFFMNLYNFTKENLLVDSIIFNLRNGKNQIQKLSQSFHQIYQFDYYRIESETKVKMPLVVQRRQYHVNLVLNVNPSNIRTIAIHFTRIHIQNF